MTKQEAIDFCKNNPESAAKTILMVDKLEQRIKELESRLNMNTPIVLNDLQQMINSKESVI